VFKSQKQNRPTQEALDRVREEVRTRKELIVDHMNSPFEPHEDASLEERRRRRLRQALAFLYGNPEASEEER
jgi:hypothetical protein